MDMLTIISFAVYGYGMYKLGQSEQRIAVGDASVAAMLSKARFPVAIAEKIEGQYYLYEKDTTNFLCQASSFEEIPMALYNNKHVSLALVMCPEETADQMFWCVNGKLKAAN